MKQQNILMFLTIALALFRIEINPQERNYNPIPMRIDVGKFVMPFNMTNGEGGLQSQFSWTYETNGNVGDISFNWPRDQWKSNMLYQIFNPFVLDDNGIVDERGVTHVMGLGGGNKTVNIGATDWAIETRRYRPPHVVVDGLPLDPPYRWYVDRNLPADQKIEFEDVLPQFGMRSHVEIYAFSNPNHDDYVIWKVTHKFTGEIRLPRNLTEGIDTIPDQTINVWFPIAFSFGPSKGGTYKTIGTYGFEAQDDLDDWEVRKSDLVTDRLRDSIYFAYYYDADNPNGPTYPSNGSADDTGDPERTTGTLMSTQIPGYALLYADKSPFEKVDDPTQPYSMPHADIDPDIWGRVGPATKLTYRGDDNRGRFPKDPITAGLQTRPGKGPMRFITNGPYELTKNSVEGRYDSVTFVYAIGSGGISRREADSIGRAWFNGEITDADKKEYIMRGKDSLWKAMDNANWAWDRMNKGLHIPSAPPPPDIEVTSGPSRITISWGYPEASYFNDAVTGIDDWHAWRVYRKRGALLVNDPLDQNSGAEWILVHETNDKNQFSFIDFNVDRGFDYYYAVTAVDNGTQNTDGLNPGEKLESSRYINMSQLPAVAFEPGLNVSDKVRVVPNPATVAAGGALTGGSPNKISFFNLPVKCTLQIFTETGDRIKVIDHYGSADEEWDQKTDSNQYVTSGIYILAVTDCEDLDGNKLDNQFVKFVIVR
jgi:hypothetical protein